MALFQRFPYSSEDASFTPLFRLLDDFDNYSREAGRTGGRQSRNTPTFNPKFDVRETEHTYELHGELPGIDRKDVSIEFTEPQTLVVRGRVERKYSAGTPPAALVDSPRSGGSITEAGEHTHHASVSDEETEAAKEKGQPAPEKDQVVKKGATKPQERYWHQERSVGEFQRVFTFPTRVNDSAVSANLKDGILHVSIPKVQKHEKRSIAIN